MSFSKVTRMKTLAQFTEAGLLIPRLAGEHRESVIAELCQRLKNSGRIDNAETFSRAVMEHEELATATLIVAFPRDFKARAATGREIGAAIIEEPFATDGEQPSA
jgi:mannitol/fructose-specific phosphotransferase system IIA component (Ntr-type)